jgi:hypothetical protein
MIGDKAVLHIRQPFLYPETNVYSIHGCYMNCTRNLQIQ